MFASPVRFFESKYHSRTSNASVTDPRSLTEHLSSSNLDIPDIVSAGPSTGDLDLDNELGAMDASDADSTVSDSDSAIGGMRDQDSTISTSSTVYKFVEKDGRTYHSFKQGKYLFPNDEQEKMRLDLQHQLMLKVLGGRLCLAPIAAYPQHVLDVGTGTGIWAIDFADLYPSATVIGTDLSPIQPQLVPPNCQFQVDDAEDEWTFSEKFDFIFMRFMIAWFSNPRFVLLEAYHHCAPGGYLEIQDGVFPMSCDDDTLEGTALDVWGKACLEGGAQIGRHWDNAPKCKHWMEESGFESVQEKEFKIPTNTWPREAKEKLLGCCFQVDLMQVLDATREFLRRTLGWEPEEIEVLLAKVRNDLKDKDIHAYMKMWVQPVITKSDILTSFRRVINGQKPML